MNSIRKGDRVVMASTMLDGKCIRRSGIVDYNGMDHSGRSYVVILIDVPIMDGAATVMKLSGSAMDCIRLTPR